MPFARGRRITDARPQSAADGVGSLPLSSALPVSAELEGTAAATTSMTTTHVRGARRVTASGVEGIAEAAPVAHPVVDATPTTVDVPAASGAAPARFKVPAAVLQRMQRREQPQEQRGDAATPRPHSIAEGEHENTTATGTSAGASTAASSPAPSTATARDEVREAEVLAAAAKADLSEADISATVAAHKSASAHHPHQRSPSNNSGSSSGGVGTSATAASPTASKPVVFSRQWRRQLFGASGAPPTAAAPVATSSNGTDVEAVLRRSRQHLTRRNGRPTSSADAGEEAELDDDLLPFGKASVKFHRTEEDEGGDSYADDAHQPASRDAPTRRQRHALRVQAQEKREQHRVHRHMAGFDEAFLARHEAHLRLHHTDDAGERSGSTSSEDGDDVEDMTEEEEEEGAMSHDSPAASTESVEEDEGEEDEEGSGVDGSSDEEQTQDADSAGALAAAAAAHGSSSNGFGAARRAEAERQRQRLQASALQAEAPAVAAKASTVDAAANAIAARSLWFKSFFFVCHEPRVHEGGCHHTLVGLRGPVTVQGPCGIIGFGLGEVTVNGFYLGRKQLNLWHEEHAAVLMPMKRLKTRHAQDMELPAWPRVPAPLLPAMPGADDPLGAPLNPLYFPASTACTNAQGGGGGAGGEDEEEDAASLLESLQWNCEAVFGAIDWDWVESMVQSWRNLFSNQLPPILLIVQPSSSLRRRDGAGPTRKFYLHGKRGRQGAAKAAASSENRRGASAPPSSSQAYMDIPSFVAHRGVPAIDLALLPGVVPSVAAQGSGAVMVLGSSNIGKSTLCRYFANVLLSQHGLCYWLDLDVGQPEFGVPGQLTLSRLRRPLLRAQDASCAEVVASYFIGANTVAQCPLTAANALAAVCILARTVGAAHPVVVNTHGWVLQTGRRVTVEALRRLRPRHVIHLCKAGEEAWAQDTDSLLDPRHGLNGEVVQRRFLVRRAGGGTAQQSAGPTGSGKRKTSAGISAGAHHNSGSTAAPPVLLCRLPYPDSDAHPSSPAQRVAVPEPGNGSRSSDDHHRHQEAHDHWRGQVHTVRVQREESFSSLERVKATKGSRGRQTRWQTYFAPLLRHYAGRPAVPSAVSGRDTAEEPETTLLEAPLCSLHSIVLAERDEKLGEVQLSPSPAAAESTVPAAGAAGLARPRPQGRGAQEQRRQHAHAAVAAALEHAVVAVLFHACPSSSTTGADTDAAPASVPAAHAASPGCVVRSLAALRGGFPVSCYGVVESTELELLHGRAGDASDASTASGWVRIRVPLRPSVVSAMLSRPAAGLPAAASTSGSATAAWATHVSIAYSAALRADTGFVDAWW